MINFKRANTSIFAVWAYDFVHCEFHPYTIAIVGYPESSWETRIKMSCNPLFLISYREVSSVAYKQITINLRNLFSVLIINLQNNYGHSILQYNHITQTSEEAIEGAWWRVQKIDNIVLTGNEKIIALDITNSYLSCVKEQLLKK